MATLSAITKEQLLLLQKASLEGEKPEALSFRIYHFIKDLFRFLFRFNNLSIAKEIHEIKSEMKTFRKCNNFFFLADAKISQLNQILQKLLLKDDEILHRSFKGLTKNEIVKAIRTFEIAYKLLSALNKNFDSANFIAEPKHLENTAFNENQKSFIITIGKAILDKKQIDVPQLELHHVEKCKIRE